MLPRKEPSKLVIVFLFFHHWASHSNVRKIMCSYSCELLTVLEKKQRWLAIIYPSLAISFDMNHLLPKWLGFLNLERLGGGTPNKSNGSRQILWSLDNSYIIRWAICRTIERCTELLEGEKKTNSNCSVVKSCSIPSRWYNYPSEKYRCEFVSWDYPLAN